MTRRRLAGVAGIATVMMLTRVLAPRQFETAVDRASEVVNDAPEPVVLGVGVVLGTVLVIGLLVYVARFYYWAWRQIEGPVTRFWNALLPESPIVRFGVGLTVMMFVFLIGPLVVLQALDYFEGDTDPVSDAQQDGNDTDNSSNRTDTGDDTANAHGDDDPEDPSEPPG